MKIYIEDNIQDITSAELESMVASLPDWRREKAMSYRREQGKKECAVSYLLLCKALREVYGISEQPRFVIGQHGKPELAWDGILASSSQPSLAGSVPHFNISHCKVAVACVVADVDVGIDVERTGRYSEAMVSYVLNDDEAEKVASSDNPDVEFTVFWTRKEALVKLTGRGIDDDLKNILVNNKDVKIHTEVHADKGYVMSVARYKRAIDAIESL